MTQDENGLMRVLLATQWSRDDLVDFLDEMAAHLEPDENAPNPVLEKLLKVSLLRCDPRKQGNGEWRFTEWDAERIGEGIRLGMVLALSGKFDLERTTGRLGGSTDKKKPWARRLAGELVRQLPRGSRKKQWELLDDAKIMDEDGYLYLTDTNGQEWSISTNGEHRVIADRVERNSAGIAQPSHGRDSLSKRSFLEDYLTPARNHK